MYLFLTTTKGSLGGIGGIELKGRPFVGSGRFFEHAGSGESGLVSCQCRLGSLIATEKKRGKQKKKNRENSHSQNFSKHFSKLPERNPTENQAIAVCTAWCHGRAPIPLDARAKHECHQECIPLFRTDIGEPSRVGPVHHDELELGPGEADTKVYLLLPTAGA